MIWICTIYPDEPTPEMKYNKEKLNDMATPLWIKVGKFVKGVGDKNVEDTEEIINRNKYLDKVPNDDWLLILDADEIVFGTIELIPQIVRQLTEKGSLSAYIAEYRADARVLYRPRLVQKKEGMKYTHKHDCILYEGRNVIQDEVRDYIECVGFLHNKSAKYLKREQIKEVGLIHNNGWLLNGRNTSN